MDRDERIARVRSYLATITPGDGLEAVEASPLEWIGLESATDERASRAHAAMTELTRGSPSEDDLFVVEAIVLPQGRPVIDIVDDTYHTPPSPWQHLGGDAIRARLHSVIPSVGRIEIPEHPTKPYAGTGFVVGDGLLMTNRHVAEIFASGATPRTLNFSPGVDFKREVDRSDTIHVDVTELVMIYLGWDMALLRVEGLPNAQRPLPLAASHPEDLVDREVAVIGYPALSASHPIDVQNEVFNGTFEVKRLQPGTVMGSDDAPSYGATVHALTHDASTLGGNSGSAVVDLDTGEVVALHFMGWYLKANYAVPSHELVTDPKVLEAGVTPAGSAGDADVPTGSGPTAVTETPVVVSDPADPENRSTNRSTDTTDTDRDAQLQELDTAVIMQPLRQHLRDRTRVHNVIVEINLRHPHGQQQTKTDVIKAIQHIMEDERHADAVVLVRKSELGGHYVFADMTSRQIERLARWNNVNPTGHEQVYKIWEDLEIDMYMDRSVSTVKADAAQAAFSATGDGIVWAVIDSGVAWHQHFEQHGNLDLSDEYLRHWDFTTREPTPIEDPKDLVDDVGHGTHVAGIIAGQSEPSTAVVYRRDHYGNSRTETRSTGPLRGVAPKCKIVSLRVVNQQGNRLTRDLMTALAHVRDINGDSPMPRIHGVNISLGHNFDARWFACGSSPVCRAVDALVKSGVSVVVAAGNGGFGTKDTLYKGAFDAGLQMTVRDPGNAMLGITVGATHGYMPHTYGVSFFSAKGPTGDGRLKPDLIAPGEKIVSCAAGRNLRDAKIDGTQHHFIESSGTSAAAPHVSGCIAAFLSLRREFRTMPEKVKQLFLDNATDLGRERYFQGHGLVDLMRVIQAV